MINPAAYYQKQIYTKIQRFATWEPGDAVAVGDIGVIYKGAFRRQTSLEVLRGNTEDYRSLTSASGVALRMDGEAKAPQGFVRLIASMQRAGSFVFEAAQVEQLRLGRVPEVVEGLRSIRDGKQTAKKWDRRWVLIDQVWKVGLGTVIIATGGASEVGVTVRGSVGPGMEALAKGDLLTDFEVRGADVYKLLGARNFTPLYTALTFDLWGNVKPLGTGQQTPVNDGLPPELDIDDFLDSWNTPEAPLHGP
jgi:hypothetical protein